MMPLESGEGPLGLIICPSRELANQTVEVITQFTDAIKAVSEGSLVLFILLWGGACLVMRETVCLQGWRLLWLACSDAWVYMQVLVWAVGTQAGSLRESFRLSDVVTAWGVVLALCRVAFLSCGQCCALEASTCAHRWTCCGKVRQLVALWHAVHCFDILMQAAQPYVTLCNATPSISAVPCSTMQYNPVNQSACQPPEALPMRHQTPATARCAAHCAGLQVST